MSFVNVTDSLHVDGHVGADGQAELSLQANAVTGMTSSPRRTEKSMILLKAFVNIISSLIILEFVKCMNAST